jgi:hypothetical protein
MVVKVIRIIRVIIKYLLKLLKTMEFVGQQFLNYKKIVPEWLDR